MEFGSNAIGQLIHQPSNVRLVVIIPHRGEGYGHGLTNSIEPFTPRRC